jgi:hypothetical protein
LCTPEVQLHRHIFWMINPPLCHGLLVRLGYGKPLLRSAVSRLDLPSWLQPKT